MTRPDPATRHLCSLLVSRIENQCNDPSTMYSGASRPKTNPCRTRRKSGRIRSCDRFFRERAQRPHSAVEKAFTSSGVLFLQKDGRGIVVLPPQPRNLTASNF